MKLTIALRLTTTSLPAVLVTDDEAARVCALYQDALNGKVRDEVLLVHGHDGAIIVISVDDVHWMTAESDN